MLTIEQIRERLKDRQLNAVAKKTGLHSNTVYKIANGAGANYETIKKLSDYLTGTGL